MSGLRVHRQSETQYAFVQGNGRNPRSMRLVKTTFTVVGRFLSHSKFASLDCRCIVSLPTVQAAPALTDSFSRGCNPNTHACKARPLTTVGRTSLSVIVIVIVSGFPVPRRVAQNPRIPRCVVALQYLSVTAVIEPCHLNSYEFVSAIPSAHCRQQCPSYTPCDECKAHQSHQILFCGFMTPSLVLVGQASDHCWKILLECVIVIVIVIDLLARLAFATVLV